MWNQMITTKIVDESAIYEREREREREGEGSTNSSYDEDLRNPDEARTHGANECVLLQL
jgi:hypothetical protein